MDIEVENRVRELERRVSELERRQKELELRVDAALEQLGELLRTIGSAIGVDVRV